jgi:Zn-dependent protease
MSVVVQAGRVRGHSVVLARHPVPIVISRGSLVPVVMLGALFALYSSGAGPLLLLGAAALGGLGGAVSLIVHELGHVRAARRLKGVKPVRVSLIWLGAGTQFEGAYRSGRDQARVAIAGPAASLAFAVAIMVGALFPMPRPVQYGLFGLVLLNISIAIVSLLPVYPLDGHKLLVGLVWRLCGSERRARTIIRRAGKSWLAVEALGSVVLLVERPEIGALVFLAGAAIYLQKRLSGRPRNLPKPVG